MTWQEWLRDMAKVNDENDYRGLLHLSNLLFDCVRQRVKPSLVREFHDYINANWPIVVTLTSEDEANGRVPPLILPIQMVIDFVATLGLKADAEGKPIEFPKATPKPRLSRVVDHLGLYQHNVDKGIQIRIMKDNGMRQKIPTPDEALDQARKSPSGYMQTSRSLAWVTTTEDLLACADDELNDNFPTAVVYRAGLSHYADMPYLIEIRYPEDFLDSEQLYSPTYFDIGSAKNFIYRSAQNEAEPDGWGYAVDIRTSLPGVREALHRPVRFDKGFEVHPIGTPIMIHNCDYPNVHLNAQERWEKGADHSTKLDDYMHRTDTWL